MLFTFFNKRNWETIKLFQPYSVHAFYVLPIKIDIVAMVTNQEIGKTYGDYDMPYFLI